MEDGGQTSRRAVVQNLAGVLATAGLAGGLLGAATVGAPAEAATLDAEGWLSRMETDLLALQSGVRPGPVADLLAARGHRADLIPRVTRGLAVAAAFRDLPHAVQRDERVQALMWREAPGMSSSLFELSDVLATLNEDEREQIGQALRDDPGLLVDVDAEVERSARRRGVSDGRHGQLRTYTSAVGWRLRRQRPSAVIDETLRKMDRVCSKFGFERADWRTASTSGISEPRLSGREGHAAAQEDPTVRAGLILLGIGGGVAGTGVLLVLVGVAATSGGLTVVGVLLAVLGLILAAVAGIVLLIAVATNDGAPRRLPRARATEPDPGPGLVPATR